MSEIDVEAIRARVEAATPGPWVPWAGMGWPKWWADYLGASTEQDGMGWGLAGPVEMAEVDGYPGRYLVMARCSEDQAFIAHARDDVPVLLDEHDRLVGLLHSHAIDPEGCEECFLEYTKAGPGHELVEKGLVERLRDLAAALEAENARLRKLAAGGDEEEARERSWMDRHSEAERERALGSAFQRLAARKLADEWDMRGRP